MVGGVLLLVVDSCSNDRYNFSKNGCVKVLQVVNDSQWRYKINLWH